jgi:glycosyltransferase involved in cell wall biosynthesis
VRRFTFLFCVPTMQLSGGIMVVLEISDRLVRAGHGVDLFSWAGPPTWWDPAARFLDAADLEDVDMSRYDFVVVTQAMLVPQVLPRLGGARCIFLAQDYESFHYGGERGYESLMAESPALAAIYRLPVPIVTISRPLVEVIRERTGRTPHHVPVGIDKSVFAEQPRPAREGPKRVLLVGNYLMPYKGMSDGLDALEHLSREMQVELVLITQEERGRDFFRDRPFAIEVHFCPGEPEIPSIMASCDVYCCTSWYEGLGLPAVEAFHCGVPVVSTRTVGVGDYGRDGVNLLLAEPNSPDDLYRKLRRVLSDPVLAERLRAEGLRSAALAFDWKHSITRFTQAVEEIAVTYGGPGPVDDAAMAGLLDALEEQGSYTPIAVVRHFWELSDRLDAVCEELGSGGGPAARHVETLATLRAQLAPYLGNPDAQYYRAFRARFDLCLLLLELSASAETVEHIPLVLSRQNGDSSHSHGPALVEHRYPVG